MFDVNFGKKEVKLKDKTDFVKDLSQNQTYHYDLKSNTSGFDIKRENTSHGKDESNSYTLQLLLNPKIKTGPVDGFNLLSIYDISRLNNKAIMFLKSLMACEGGINRTLRSGTGDIEGGNLSIVLKERLTLKDYFLKDSKAYVNTVVTNPAGLSAFNNSRLTKRKFRVEYTAKVFQGFECYQPVAVVFEFFKNQMPDFLENVNQVEWSFIDDISKELYVEDFIRVLKQIVNKVGAVHSEDVMDFCAYYNQAWHNPAHAINNRKFLIRSTKYEKFFLYDSRRTNFLGVFK